MAIPLLYNIDCNTMLNLVYPPARREAGRYTIANMTDYIDLLAASGVTTVLMNGNGQSPWYPSRRTASVYAGYRRGDTDYVRGHFPPLDADFTQADLERVCAGMTRLLDRCLDLEEDGVDWFAVVRERIEARGMTAWVSVRMNDAHGGNSWDRSFFNCAVQRDGRYRLSGAGYEPSGRFDGRYQLMDYRHAEVRAYFLTLIAEALEDYGYAGIELDWLRMPLCWEPPAGAEAFAVMQGFFREVRALAEAQAARLGRPVPVQVRAPLRLGFLRGVGLDLVALAQDGLIDSIALSNFFQTSWDVDYAALRAQLPARTRIVGVIESTPNWVKARNPAAGRERYRMLPPSPELIRGNVAGKLAGGCDAIEFFNFFAADEYNQGRNPDASQRQAAYPALRGVTDLEALRGQALQYSLQNMYGPYDFPIFESAEQLPSVIDAGHQRAFRVALIAQGGATLQVDLVTAADPGATLAVSLNQAWPAQGGEATETLLRPVGEFTHHAHPVRRFTLDAAALSDGLNTLLVFNHGDAPVQVIGLDIATTPAAAAAAP